MWLAKLEVRLVFQEIAKRLRSIEQMASHAYVRSNFVGGIKSYQFASPKIEELKMARQRLRLLFCDHLNIFEHSSATSTAPDNLAQALDELEADKVLVEAVGSLLVDNHVFMKRAEVEKTAKLEGESLRDFYINYI